MPMEPAIISKRLGPLRTEQFDAALARFDLGNFIRAELIPFGLFGQNVFVTSTAGEFVLRGSPHFEWQFPTERFFVDLLHRETVVPVPSPYLIDESPEIFGWSYVLMPRMPGIQVDDPKVKVLLSPGDRRQMAHAMGETLAAMHQVTSNICGRYDMTSRSIKPFDRAYELAYPFPPRPEDLARSRTISNRERVLGVIRRLLDKSRIVNDQTTDADANWVEEVIASNQHAMRDDFRPSIVMEDFKEGNVVFEQRGASWRVGGLFDLMGAHFGDPEADLSRTSASYFDENPELAREFVLTYLSTHPASPGFGSRFQIFMLLDRMIVWEFVQRHEGGVALKDTTLRAWAGRYVDLLRTIAAQLA
jgi:aminoglycoside phosphotransferase (APT) family kinase protein